MDTKFPKSADTPKQSLTGDESIPYSFEIPEQPLNETPARKTGSSSSYGHDSSKVSIYLRRMVDEMEEVMRTEFDDAFARYEAMNACKAYWGLAYKNRNVLNEYARRFLGGLQPVLNSNHLVDDPIAFGIFDSVIKQFARFIDGVGQKDVDRWYLKLDEAGFDFARPVVREIPKDRMQEFGAKPIFDDDENEE